MRHVRMTPAQWIGIRDYTGQRNTERHAKRILAGLQKSGPLEVQAKVAMAEFPDGSTMKVDGHTRAFLWARHVIPAPRVVHVDVYDVSSIEDVDALYAAFDSTASSKTATDSFYGAMQLAGITPTCPHFLGGKGSYALLLAESVAQANNKTSEEAEFPLYEACVAWKNEIKKVDKLVAETSSAGMVSGVLAAMFATFRRYPTFADEFWRSYLTPRAGMTTDPDIFLRTHQRQRKTDRKNAGHVHVYEMMAMAIYVFERARTDKDRCVIKHPKMSDAKRLAATYLTKKNHRIATPSSVARRTSKKKPNEAGATLHG